MPAYQAAGAPTRILYCGESEIAWNAEQPTAGTTSASASQSFALNSGVNEKPGCVASGKFSSAPGTFEIDLLGSEVDTFANYTLLGSVTAVDGNNNWRIAYDADTPSFVLLLMKSRANAVTVTAYVTKN